MNPLHISVVMLVLKGDLLFNMICCDLAYVMLWHATQGFTQSLVRNHFI